MKKYIFLLVFFTHLIVLEAQANTRTWIGSVASDDWSLSSNWDTGTIPDGNSIVNIPHLATGLKYPKLSLDSSAKSITIEADALLDLSSFVVKKADTYLCKIINKGILSLVGTQAHKAWFDNIVLPINNEKISLEDGCTVVYYSGATDDIFAGPYENLTLLRDVNATSLTVNKKTLIGQGITIKSEIQNYNGAVEIWDNTTFTTNTENGTINFNSAVIAKNTVSHVFTNITITKGIVNAKEKITANKLDVSGKSFISEKDIELEDNFEGKSKKIETKGLVKAKNITIASSTDEWISNNLTITDDIAENGKIWKCNGVIQAKKINVGATCNNWTSTDNISVEENIVVNDNTVWKANSGDISFKKDLTASKLEQETGKVIANGNGNQNVKAKKIKELEIAQTSVSSLLSLSPTVQTIERINNSGTFTISAGVITDIAEIDNKTNATFNSNTTTLTLTTYLKNAGTLNIASLKLLPTGTIIKIEGNSLANQTSISHLLFENAGGKTLSIKDKITISNELKLKGTSKTNLLNVEGDNGAISVSSSLTGEGEFLNVKTNIPIENGVYKTKHSKPDGTVSEINAGKPENWIFNKSLYTTLTWKGGMVPNPTAWENSENWIPRGIPHEETDVIIPTGKPNYPILSADVNAKTVELQIGATVDLATFQILTTGSAGAKLNNSGLLSLSGTNAQKAWFEAGSNEHKIILNENSTVAYHTGSTDPIYAGAYKNLTLSRNVSGTSLTVENTTKITQAISITAESQLYRGRVEALEDVSFATTSDNGTINFEDEVLVKNSGTNAYKNITITKGIVNAKEKVVANIFDLSGTSFIAEKKIELEDNFEGKSKKIETKGLVKAKNINIATSNNEWISNNLTITDDIAENGKIWKCNGVIQAKKINVGATCNNWTSTDNISVEENIVVNDNTVWKANSGDISFKKDLTASKLEQETGKVIANGNGNQNVKAKKIKELEIAQTSVSSLLSLSPTPQTIEKISSSGTLNIPTNTDLTIAELNNRTGATFTSASEIKLTKAIVNAGSLNISTLLPYGNAVKIEGTSNQNDTTIDSLAFENASEKILEIKNNINVSSHLKLSGVDATHVLEVKGPGKIYLPSSFNDKGKFLHVHTNIPLEGATCITEKSKPIGSNAEIIAGKPENWIFDDPIMILTWEGSNNNNWLERENWRPKGLPSEETETLIPNGKNNYPILSADVNAKTVSIEAGNTAALDLSTFLIKTASSKLSKISNSGLLKLEGINSQKAWFEAADENNKIILENNSTVFYYGSSTDPIYAGAYKNLTLSRNVSGTSLTVENTTKITQAISITAESQLYKGRVEALEDVNFATTSDNGTINFDAEVLVKDSGTNAYKNITITKGIVNAKEKITANIFDLSGTSFIAEKEIELEDNFEGKSKKIETKGLVKAKNINIATSNNEWISNNLTITDDIAENGKLWKCNGIVQAKNINVGATCNNWTSSNNITVLESIEALTTQWNATDGIISVFKNCNSPKLEQVQGSLILNGNGEQNLIAKTLDKLEMQNTSPTDKMKLQVETIAEFILQTGNASLLQDIIITKTFANNGGVFNAFENEKVVILKPIDNKLTIKGKLTITGDPNPTTVDTGTKFYQLHCKNAGGKELHFVNAIEILYDISTESGYIAPPNENFTQDEKSLVLEGGNASSKLKITGNAQIWFCGTPPYPKPKKGGKFLHVASGVQIRGGCYRVMRSSHDRPAPRNWIFEEYAKIISSLAINGTDEVCIKFSRKLTKPVPDSLKITIPSQPDMISISVNSYPKGSNKMEADIWFFQFAQDFTPTMLLEKQAVISLGESSLDFIFEDPDSDLYPFKKGYISDIGLNLVNPVLAKNTKQIQTFDGSKKLPFINTSLFVDVPQVLDGKTLTLYVDTNASFLSKYWVPNKTNIPWKTDFKATQVENSNAVGFSINVEKSTPDTKMFIIPTTHPQLKLTKNVGFMLSYEDLPCARLKNPNDIFSFDLWRFDFIGTILQRAGVTILKNVINVSRNQQVGIEITTKESGILTVQIMTLDGSIVKTFANDYKPQGNYSYYWDGRNEAGRLVARGMYFVRISGKGIDEVRKVLVTHD